MSAKGLPEGLVVERLEGGPDALRRVWAALGDAFDPPIWERYANYDAFVEKVATHAVTLVARAGATPCGSISFYANDADSRRAYVTEVLVAPACQGRGVGSLLLRACEDYALRAGMTSVALEVARDNKPALGLYAKMGFAPERERGATYLMAKRLHAEA